MKRTILFAAAAGLLLVSNAPPPGWGEDWEDDARAGGYPPCSRTVTDRCIQLYERGVATRTNLALNEHLGMNTPGIGMGGPFEPVHTEAYHDGDTYADDGADHVDARELYADGGEYHGDAGEYGDAHDYDHDDLAPGYE
jgi:hypothetical protein